ncbi:MAG: hypothetical protein BWY77_01147 [bacterium ADurb.Bin431]|nr:MAG: hypothetical protein BWY77_01147 [bacterium ADurb.Bin431]
MPEPGFDLVENHQPERQAHVGPGEGAGLAVALEPFQAGEVGLFDFVFDQPGGELFILEGLAEQPLNLLGEQLTGDGQGEGPAAAEGAAVRFGLEIAVYALLDKGLDAVALGEAAFQPGADGLWIGDVDPGLLLAAAGLDLDDEALVE